MGQYEQLDRMMDARTCKNADIATTIFHNCEGVEMNDGELIRKIHSAMYHHCQKRSYVTPVGVLMDIGVLPKQKYEDWRLGKEDCLERVCTVNLRKLSFILHQMRIYAQKSGLKPSFCYYKQWGVKEKNGQGHKLVIPLRFSKSGNAEIEKSYATHFIDLKRTAQLKTALEEPKQFDTNASEQP